MQAIQGRSENAPRIAGRGTTVAPSGPVWICEGSSEVTDVALRKGAKEALRGVRTYWRAPPAHVIPSVAIYCCSGGDATGEIANVVGDLKRVAPRSAVVIMCDSASLPLARAALRAGARGVLHSGMPPEQIARAVSMAENGETVLPRELLNAVAAEVRGEKLPVLSERKRQLLGLLDAGLSNAEIAAQLFLSESTVKQHLRATYKLLKVRNRTEAAAAFRRRKRLWDEPGVEGRRV